MGKLALRLLDFQANRAPALPRDAATVIVVRDGSGGLEVFAVERHRSSGFLGGAIVFPGGKLDANDSDASWSEHVVAPSERASKFAATPALARALAIAAVRETLEEGAILPVDGPLDHDGALQLRNESDQAQSLVRALAQRGLRARLDALVPWARWVTPEAEARRFDARFYLLRAPDGQRGSHDRRETTMSLWARPKALLERAEAGEIFLAPPTSRALELLTDARDVSAALALAESQPLDPICPVFVPPKDGYPAFLALPGDPAHSDREPCVAGKTRYVLRDARFVAEDAPA